MSKLEAFAILSISLHVHNDSEWHVAKRAYQDGFNKALELAREKLKEMEDLPGQFEFVEGAAEIVDCLAEAMQEEA